jgi:kinetochore protein Nuf2
VPSIDREQKASDIPRIEAATARNDAIRLELQALKKEQTALTAEVARLDDVKKGLKEQIVSLCPFPFLSPLAHEEVFANVTRSSPHSVR